MEKAGVTDDRLPDTIQLKEQFQYTEDRGSQRGEQNIQDHHKSREKTQVLCEDQDV